SKQTASSQCTIGKVQRKLFLTAFKQEIVCYPIVFSQALRQRQTQTARTQVPLLMERLFLQSSLLQHAVEDRTCHTASTSHVSQSRALLLTGHHRAVRLSEISAFVFGQDSPSTMPSAQKLET